MPMIEKYLDVKWFEQETLFYCGPAVAQMSLDYVKVAVSQDTLWNDIKSNTGGNRPPDAPPSNHGFPEQVCDNCEPNDRNPPMWECWDTTPEALRTTVTAHGGVGHAAQYPSTFEHGVTLLIESLDRSPAVPPFATIQLINHWVLVNGYRLNDEASLEAPPETVGKYRLNGLYILDPQELDRVERVRLVPVSEWHSKFGLIGCGPHVDTYPVVVGGVTGLAARVRSALIIVVLLGLVLLVLRWWLG
jgi:hypothetical protein